MSVLSKDKKFNVKSLIYKTLAIRSRIVSEIYSEQLCKNIVDIINGNFSRIIREMNVSSLISLNQSYPRKMYEISYLFLIDNLTDILATLDEINMNIDLICDQNYKIYSRINHFNLIELEEIKTEILNWKNRINKKASQYFYKIV